MLDSGELTLPEKEEVEAKLKVLDEELEAILPEEKTALETELVEKESLEGSELKAAEERIEEIKANLEVLKTLEKERNTTVEANQNGAEKARDEDWFRKKGILSDVKVKAGEDETDTYNLHRVTLASKSNFFYQRLVDPEEAVKEIKNAFKVITKPDDKGPCYKQDGGNEDAAAEEEAPAEEAAPEAPPLTEAGGTLEVEDPGGIFKEVIKAIYQGGDQVHVTEENVFKLLKGAIDWDVPELLTRVHAFLEETMTTANAASRLLEAEKLGDEELMNACFEAQPMRT